jgi:3-oxoacyl-[acyl-carrier protein] reductase
VVEDVRRTNMRRFEGKSVIVTGGARGIGEATSARFLGEGARVLVADVNPEHIAAALPGLEKIAEAAGGELAHYCGDVSIPEDVEAMVELALDRFGNIDVLVSNAGIAYQESFLDISIDHWDRIIAVNLRSMFLVAQRVAREMVKQDQGVILLTSSTNGLVGEGEFAHYNASKGGVTLLAKSMAIELGPNNVRVNAVCPGFIMTPITRPVDDPVAIARRAEKTKLLPLRRIGRPDEVAALFAFLASDDAAYITGETVVIDGGLLAA